MADVVHDFPIFAPADRVFAAVATPAGLDQWWSKQASSNCVAGATIELHFGTGYEWRAAVRACVANERIEYELTDADDDWRGTRVGFELTAGDGRTQVRFRHTGWPEANEHYRISCFCWAMYLRILKRYVEHGETVPYEKRLDV